MKLLVVIVNYRVAPLLVECLRSVAEERDRVPDSRVAVCENGSGDNSANVLRAAIDRNGWRDWCTLTVSRDNLGFTGGNNLVIRPVLAGPDTPRYVLLLNPDTVVRSGAFEALVEFMDRNPKVESPVADWRIRTAHHNAPPSASNPRSENSKAISASARSPACSGAGSSPRRWSIMRVRPTGSPAPA